VLDPLKQRYLSTLPMQESFFYTTPLQEQKRFERDILYLNFAHLSPYKDFELLPFYEGNRLLLWITPSQIDSKPFVIPEAYLLYQTLQKEYGDGIFMIEDSIDKVLVIKTNRLEAAYCGYHLQEQKEVLLDEYGVENIYLISQVKAKNMLEQALTSYPIWQYYHWYHAQESIKDKALEYLNRATLPIAVVIALFIASEYAKDRYIASSYEKLQEEYKSIKKQNDPYRNERKALKESIAFNNSFYHDVLIYPNSMDVMEHLFGIVAHENNSTIKNLKLSGSKMTLNIETLEPISILNAVLKSGYFATFKIQSTRKIRKSEKEYVSYEGTLKRLKDSDGE